MLASNPRSGHPPGPRLTPPGSRRRPVALRPGRSVPFTGISARLEHGERGDHVPVMRCRLACRGLCPSSAQDTGVDLQLPGHVPHPVTETPPVAHPLGQTPS